MHYKIIILNGNHYTHHIEHISRFTITIFCIPLTTTYKETRHEKARATFGIHTRTFIILQHNIRHFNIHIQIFYDYMLAHVTLNYASELLV